MSSTNAKPSLADYPYKLGQTIPYEELRQYQLGFSNPADATPHDYIWHINKDKTATLQHKGFMARNPWIAPLIGIGGGAVGTFAGPAIMGLMSGGGGGAGGAGVTVGGAGTGTGTGVGIGTGTAAAIPSTAFPVTVGTAGLPAGMIGGGVGGAATGGGIGAGTYAQLAKLGTGTATSLLSGRGGGDMDPTMARLLPQLEQMFAQAQRRQTATDPIYDAVLRMVMGQLPGWSREGLAVSNVPPAPAAAAGPKPFWRGR